MNAPLESLAVLLRYPDAGYPLALSDAHAVAGAHEEIVLLARELEPLSASEIEELYTRTFDLSPVAALEVGWQLWGDAYERGRFLAEMRERLVRFGVEESGELPDHLSNVLLLLARLDAKEAAELAGPAIEAVDKMRAALGDSANPYRFLIGAVAAALRERFGDATAPAAAAAEEVTP